MVPLPVLFNVNAYPPAWFTAELLIESTVSAGIPGNAPPSMTWADATWATAGLVRHTSAIHPAITPT